ncbi:MAG: SDR family NAD(P)-dependent oxidoreductase [Catenulispora sp.]
MGKVVFVPGASGSFGALTARALADAGHTVYAGISRITNHNADITRELREHARRNSADLRPVELEVEDRRSVDSVVRAATAEAGRIDVVVHTTAPAVFGPAESFTPYQLSQIYDLNVLSSQRVNRAVLPQMRQRRSGLLIWMGNFLPCAAAPYLAPYFAARAALDLLARSYAAELTPFGIDTHVLVPPSLPSDAGEPAGLVHPDDIRTAEAYEELCAGVMRRAKQWLAHSGLADAELTRAVIAVVENPKAAVPLSEENATLSPGELRRSLDLDDPEQPQERDI